MIVMNAKFIKQIGVTLLYLPLIFLILLIAAYPLKFFLAEGKVGILTMKSDALLTDWTWKIFFYMHITFGGLALLVGWTQFNKYLRQQFISLHRILGKVYVFATGASVLGVGYIAFSAEGGTVAFVGFMLGGLIWAYTTLQAYRKIKVGNVMAHRKFMHYSYAVCLGAVTLRIWLPLLVTTTNNFILSYQLVAWISWAPNLLVAYFIAGKVTYTTAVKHPTHRTTHFN